MHRQKSDIYSLLGSSAKRSNLNIDDLIYQFKMRKCNNRLAKQYSEIIKIFDHKPVSGFESKRQQLRLKTDESIEPLQSQRLSNQLDIHQIIRETSPVKITPRLNYENFKTFQESVQNSEESKYHSSSLAKFGPSSSNQCETDEEIQQISKQSVQKLSKFKHVEVFEQSAIKICQQIENKNTKLIKQGFHMIKVFSKWTVKEKATNQFIQFFEQQLRYYFDLLLIYEKSVDGRRSVNYDSDEKQYHTQKKESQVLAPISINLPTFSSPNQIKTTNQFGVINFEEYLKKQKKFEQ